MKLLIAGSICIDNYNFTNHVGDNVDLIINGGADGFDKTVNAFADEHGLSKLILRPNHKQYGDDALYYRDKQMVEICDSILLIWNGKSQEIINIINFATKLEKPIKVILYTEQVKMRG